MMRSWVGVTIGVIVGAVLSFAAISILRSNDEPKPDVRKKASAEPVVASPVRKGTKVEFVLLEPLSSGGSDVGDTVQIVVSNDVKDRKGRVVIPIGTVAKLEVVRSREASAMTSLVNQPARLEVRFLALDAEGVEFQLAADADDPEANLELTRATANTGISSTALKALWEHPETKRFLTNLADRMNGENTRDDFDDLDSRRIMAEVAGQLGMSKLQEASDDGKSVGALLVATEKVSRGGFMSVGTSEAMLAIQAVSELGRLANGVDRGLRGTFKGRNIGIPIGTRLTAYVAREVTITR